MRTHALFLLDTEINRTHYPIRYDEIIEMMNQNGQWPAMTSFYIHSPIHPFVCVCVCVCVTVVVVPIIQ